VGKICFVFDFILHTAYTVDAYALNQHAAFTVFDVIYFTADTKSTPASIFKFLWISYLHDVLKCVFII
jgi:hypothetical protein